MKPVFKRNPTSFSRLTVPLVAGGILFWGISNTPAAPQFTITLAPSNPFAGITAAGGFAAPTFVDIDGDTDFDMFLGQGDGTVAFFENIGTRNSSSFTIQARDTFGASLDLGGRNSFDFADIDNDLTDEVLFGNAAGELKYFRATGSQSSPPIYNEFTIQSPFAFTISSNSAPRFVDIEGDGDLDLAVGDSTGKVEFYENVGSASAPSFTCCMVNLLAQPTLFGSDAVPAFADLDSDGDMDAVVGGGDGSLRFFENMGSGVVPRLQEFTIEARDSRKAAGIDKNFPDSHDNAAPALVDLDADGAVDVVIGASDGGLTLYEGVNFPARVDGWEMME